MRVETRASGIDAGKASAAAGATAKSGELSSEEILVSSGSTVSSLAIVGCVEREEVAASLPKPYQHRVRVKTCGESTRLNDKLSMQIFIDHLS
jgi:hypothetical protein